MVEVGCYTGKTLQGPWQCMQEMEADRGQQSAGEVSRGESGLHVWRQVGVQVTCKGKQ
jgi:hypothetical protein